MAAQTVAPSAAGVHIYSNAIISRGQVGEAGTIGKVMYLKAADGKWWLADNSALATADAKAILLTPGPAADDYAVLLKKGGFDPGENLDTNFGAGDTLYVEDDGDMGNYESLANGEYVTKVGSITVTAAGTSRIEVNFDATGIVKAA